jgi:hypothetical protein
MHRSGVKGAEHRGIDQIPGVKNHPDIPEHGFFDGIQKTGTAQGVPQVRVGKYADSDHDLIALLQVEDTCTDGKLCPFLQPATRAVNPYPLIFPA